jgi:cellulose synthase/poly-beta-1,6-N-acetylglucosamine synthase-like glycosyltransferase
VDCKAEVEKYNSQLTIRYFEKPNSGPGQSRNYGAERTDSDFVIFLDSDCILPPGYIAAIRKELANAYVDAFGGPDEAHESFTDLQKAINYSMTSFFTTGGIRGGKKRIGVFHPRSFNMGFSRKVYEHTKGFGKMRFGEDIDMSLRIIEAGFSTRLFPEAFVYHKRRTSWRQFYKQIYNSGIARINLYRLHPDSLKPLHFMPAVFTLGEIGVVVLAMLHSPLWLIFPAFHMLLLLVDSTLKNRSLKIGLLSVLAGYIQLTAYGLGFIKAFFKRIVLKRGAFAAFEKNFYD